MHMYTLRFEWMTITTQIFICLEVLSAHNIIKSVVMYLVFDAEVLNKNSPNWLSAWRA